MIERLRFFYYDKYQSKNIYCNQDSADDYKLELRPLKSTGDITWIMPNGEEYREWKHGNVMPPGTQAKTKVITHVKNVVLLEPYEA